MSVISSRNIYEIIRRSLCMINSHIVEHGEIVGYMFYKMLEYDGRIINENDLIDYALIGMYHDIGLFREENVRNVADYEIENVWQHSIYGFLFLKYLSPLKNAAEIVLYHHLNYELYKRINSPYMQICSYLNFADKMDTFLRSEEKQLDSDYFTHYRDERFSGEAMDLFEAADAQNHIIENINNGNYRKELYDLITKRKYNEKEKMMFLKMLVFTIDFRSEHTVVHTMSAVHFAVQLGKIMKVSKEDLRNLYYGTLLHDLGKIAIPLEILESNGKLSEEEMTVMKSHVELTEVILDGVVEEEVLEIAIRHHEKLDGSGYPRGLKKEDLTMPQQIIAVADILSALYGKRSYKSSFDKEKIQAILNGDAEKMKISPEVVTRLMGCYDEVIANYEKEKDKMLGVYLMLKEQFESIIKKFAAFE